MEDKLLLKPSEVAKITGISINTIHIWCRYKINDFPCFKVGRDYKIPRFSLEKWLIEQARKDISFN